MTRSLFIENVRLSGISNACVLAEACGVSKAVIQLWSMSVVSV